MPDKRVGLEVSNKRWLVFGRDWEKTWTLSPHKAGALQTPASSSSPISSLSQILNIAYTSYKQQADPSSIKVYHVLSRLAAAAPMPALLEWGSRDFHRQSSNESRSLQWKRATQPICSRKFFRTELFFV